MNTLFPLAYPPGGSGPHRTIANFQEMLLNENRTPWAIGKPIEKTGILVASDDSIGPVPGADPGDFQKVRIQLRPNVRFHSGAKLTSESLSGPFDFQHVYDNSNWPFYYPTRRGGMTTEIVDELSADMIFARSSFNNIQGFRHPGRPFLWNPAWVEEHGIEGRGANLGGEDQDGTGPFKVKEWIPGTRIIMERNRDYWADNLPDSEKQEQWGKASGNVDEIIFVFISEPAAQVTALQAGDIDVILEAPLAALSQIERRENLGTHIPEIDVAFPIYLNTLYKPLQDLRVRQAIQKVIDPIALRALYDDRMPVARGFYLPWSLGHDPNVKAWKTKDEGGAKQLMAESGYKDGFDLKIGPDTRENPRLMGTALAPMISKTGINATVNVYQPTEWNTITSDREQTQIHMYSFTIGMRKEPFDFLDFIFRARFRRLRSSMDVPFLHGTFDPTRSDNPPGRPDTGLLGRIGGTKSEEERVPMYKDAAQFIVDEALLFMPLWLRNVGAYNKKITNIPDRFGPFRDHMGIFFPYAAKM